MVATDWDTLTLALAPISISWNTYEKTKETFKKYEDIRDFLKL